MMEVIIKDLIFQMKILTKKNNKAKKETSKRRNIWIQTVMKIK
jgi:hypothetical protein